MDMMASMKTLSQEEEPIIDYDYKDVPTKKSKDRSIDFYGSPNISQ